MGAYALLEAECSDPPSGLPACTLLFTCPASEWTIAWVEMGVLLGYLLPTPPLE
jgi:hypothetical protein